MQGVNPICAAVCIKDIIAASVALRTDNEHPSFRKCSAVQYVLKFQHCPKAHIIFAGCFLKWTILFLEGHAIAYSSHDSVLHVGSEQQSIHYIGNMCGQLMMSAWVALQQLQQALEAAQDRAQTLKQALEAAQNCAQTSEQALEAAQKHAQTLGRALEAAQDHAQTLKVQAVVQGAIARVRAEHEKVRSACC